MNAILPAAVMVIGLLLWALATNPIVKKAGEILFAIGAFWTVAELSPVSGKLFSRL